MEAPNNPEKRIAVVGSSRGIGLATTRLILESGWSVLASTKGEHLSPALLELRERFGDRIETVQVNLMETEDRRSLALKFREFGLNGLVLTAAVPSGGMLSMTPISQFRSTFDVNFFAQVELMQVVSRMLASSGGGSIVSVSSMTARAPMAGTAAYASSKAALSMASQVLAAEMGPFGVRVNVVAPSLVETEMLDEMDPASIKRMLCRSSLSRVALPEEIARVIVFLLRDDSSYMSGCVVDVDGGKC